MPVFGFLDRNLLRLANRGSRLAARGSGSQTRKIASPVQIELVVIVAPYFSDGLLRVFRAHGPVDTGIKRDIGYLREIIEICGILYHGIKRDIE